MNLLPDKGSRKKIHIFTAIEHEKSTVLYDEILHGKFKTHFVRPLEYFYNGSNIYIIHR